MSVEAVQSNAAQSAQALNEVLQSAVASQVDLAAKLIKASVEIALQSVSPEGVGGNVDVVA